MEWYIILIIGLLPFVLAFVIGSDWGMAEIPVAFVIFVVWGTILVYALTGEYGCLKSPDPITPELRITVKDSTQDTLYIYR